MAEDAIKNGAVVEMVSGVIDDALYDAKHIICLCMDHTKGQELVNMGFILETLKPAHDLCTRLLLVVNFMNKMAGFDMIHVTARAVNSGVCSLWVQTAKL